MGQFRPLSARRAGPRRRGVSTFGLVLIVLGLIGLLVTYSFLPGWVPRFWPLLIVPIGLLGLFRRPAFVHQARRPGPRRRRGPRTGRGAASVSPVVGIGLLLLVFTSHLVDERIASPAVIIALGVALLWRRYR